MIFVNYHLKFSNGSSYLYEFDPQFFLIFIHCYFEFDPQQTISPMVPSGRLPDYLNHMFVRNGTMSRYPNKIRIHI